MLGHIYPPTNRGIGLAWPPNSWSACPTRFAAQWPIYNSHSGQKLGYFYHEEEPGRRSAAKLLGKDEAGRIAANVTKLPELLRK
jgi:hypothetical protein